MNIGGLTFPNDLSMQSKRSTVSVTRIEVDKESGLNLNDKNLLVGGHFLIDFPDINACYNPGN